MRHGDITLHGGDGDHILLSRLAILERRMEAMADLLAPAAEDCDDEAGLPQSLLIEPDGQTELAQGFHLREHDAAGRAFRWAGRERYFEFRFFLDRRSARVFRMRGLFAPAVAEAAFAGGVSCFVDYRPIPVHVARAGEGDDTATIEGRIPADRLNPGVTLTVFCPAAPSPNPADGRRLSFAFQHLRVGDAPADALPELARRVA